MKLEWKFLIDDEVETCQWEDGKLTGYPLVTQYAQMLTEVEPIEEVEIFWGWFFAPASLDNAEAAWGTIRHAIKALGGQMVNEPDPVFQMPDDGLVY